VNARRQFKRQTDTKLGGKEVRKGQGWEGEKQLTSEGKGKEEVVRAAKKEVQKARSPRWGKPPYGILKKKK